MPNYFLNHLQERLGVETDFALSKKLNINHTVMPRIRSGDYGISERFLAAVLVALPNSTKAELQRLAGMPED